MAHFPQTLVSYQLETVKEFSCVKDVIKLPICSFNNNILKLMHSFTIYSEFRGCTRVREFLISPQVFYKNIFSLPHVLKHKYIRIHNNTTSFCHMHYVR